MNEVNIRKPIPKAISDVDAGTLPFTQSTRSTGTVLSLVETAIAAPVSSTLLVKTRMAPEKAEYLVNGKRILLKIVRGFPPSVLAASSIFGGTLSIAADIDLTK